MSLGYIYPRDKRDLLQRILPLRDQTMPRRSQLTLAKPEILRFLDASSRRVFTWKDIAHVLQTQRERWRLALHTTTSDFVSFLEAEGTLQERTYRSQTYNRKITRYSYGQPSQYELAQSLKSHGYFSHAGAIALHGLVKKNATGLYLNVEQSPKPRPGGELTQQRIDHAFSRQQRQSNLTYEHGDSHVTIINGKNTCRLEVEDFVGPQSEALKVTSIERTLIDIAVRPSYSGGVSSVLEAYRSAKHRASLRRLVPLLRKLDYVYPYHQAIGFLMERSGYPESQLSPLRALGIKLNFYLAHGLDNPTFDPKWKIFHPPLLLE